MAHYRLPGSVGADLLSRYEELSQTDIGTAKVGLRQWLRLHTATSRLLGMPSRGVDLLWHEFILDTTEYSRFCRQAYGRLLHHYPTSEMAARGDPANDEALALTFGMACRDEGMPVKSPPHLPVLFSVDSDLNLLDGQRWVLSCGGEATCRASESKRCARHLLLRLIPDDLPKLVRIGPGRQLLHADSQITGYGATGTCGGGHGCGGAGH